MITPRSLASLLLLTAAAFGQTSSHVSPHIFYDKNSDGGTSSMFGQYADATLQFADGSMRGKSGSIKAISMQHAPETYYEIYNNEARTWRKYTLSVSSCQLSRITTNLATNATSTPTKVYAGTLNLPQNKGYPASTWSPVRISFTKPWVYDGKADALIESRFEGGRLASNRAWSLPMPYILKAFQTGDLSIGPFRWFGGWGPNGGCSDSSLSPQTPAFATLYPERYSPSHSNPILKGRVRVFSDIQNVPGGTTVASTLSFGLVAAGVPFPNVTCNKVYVDPRLPLLITFQKTGSSSTHTHTNPFYWTTNQGVPYTGAMRGLPLVVQGAWEDRRTSELRLTAAASAKVPELNVFSSASAAKRILVGAYTNGSRTVPINPRRDGRANPVFWWSY